MLRTQRERERIPCFQIDFAAWLVPVAANVSASSSCDSIATAGAEAVNGYFMDVAHCDKAAEDIFGPDALQLGEIAATDTSVVHHLDPRLALPAIDIQFRNSLFSLFFYFFGLVCFFSFLSLAFYVIC